MATDLIVYKRPLMELAPRFQHVLSNSMKAERLIETVLIAIERNPKLANAPVQQVLAGAMTFANLRLPCDGVTGQGFLIPFTMHKGTAREMVVVQPVIGYKGFNTIGARSGVTITAGLWRQGDLEFEYREGTGGFIHHKKKIDNQGDILAAWAVAEAHGRPPAVQIVGIKELLEIKSRSPAVKYKAETPWNDVKIGFPAMCEKTPKRRLSRVLPFEVDDGRFALAARMDEAHDEQGKYSRIGERGDLIIDGEVSPVSPSEPGPTPTAEALTAPKIDNDLARLRDEGDGFADAGTPALREWFEGLSGREQRAIGTYLDTELKPRAMRADAAKKAGS
jgi:phage RecT family recombinase